MLMVQQDQFRAMEQTLLIPLFKLGLLDIKLLKHQIVHQDSNTVTF